VATTGFGNGMVVIATKEWGDRQGIRIHSSKPLALLGSKQRCRPNIPVEIISKNPSLTTRLKPANGRLGRRSSMEGLVHSGGTGHSNQVVQGIGHGLDERAVRAAQKNKVKPALHEGQPVDSAASRQIVSTSFIRALHASLKTAYHGCDGTGCIASSSVRPKTGAVLDRLSLPQGRGKHCSGHSDAR